VDGKGGPAHRFHDGRVDRALVSTSGWQAMNEAVLPLLAVIAAAVLWLAHLRRRKAARAAPAD